MRFTVHHRRQHTSPAQLHLYPHHHHHQPPGPVWPIRMICPLSFHHPAQDNTGGRGGGREGGRDFQTFGNVPLRVSVGANYQLCSQTQWPFCFTGAALLSKRGAAQMDERADGEGGCPKASAHYTRYTDRDTKMKNPTGSRRSDEATLLYTWGSCAKFKKVFLGFFSLFKSFPRAVLVYLTQGC